MKTIVISLPFSAGLAEKLAAAVGGTFRPYDDDAFREAYQDADRIIAVMATGIVVRKIAPLLRDKWQDPPVVVVSPDMRFAIPVTGGHHGGNELAKELAARFGLTPVITTATEAAGKPAAETIATEANLRVVNTDSTRISNAAVLAGTAGVYTVEGPGMVIAGKGVTFLVAGAPYVAGLGCRRGTPAPEIRDAIDTALADAGLGRSDVSIYATSTLKLHDSGLDEAIREIGGNLIYLDHETLCRERPASGSAARRFGLPGVAEPAALAVSFKKELIMEKHVYGNVTVAFAR